MTALSLSTPVWAESLLGLSQALDEAVRANPELQAARAHAEAGASRAGPLVRLPPPTFGIDWMGQNGPFRSGDQAMEPSLELSQTLPFPTKLAADRRARQDESQAAQGALEAATLELKNRVESAFFDYYRTHETLNLQTERVEILKTHLKLIRSGPVADVLSQAHRLQADADLQVAQAESEASRAEDRLSQGQLSVLLGRDPLVPLGEPVEPPLQAPPALPDASTLDAQLENHPRIASVQAEKKTAEANLDLAKASWFPDFTIKYRHGSSFGPVPEYNQIVFGVDLPFLLFWQPKADVAEASARMTERELRVSESKNEFRLSILKASSRATSLRAQILSYENQILPKAKRRMELAHGIAPTDMESQMEHRAAMEGYVDARLKLLSLRTDYQKSLADLRALLPKNPEEK